MLKLCSMAQFDDYYRRDDGERYGIEGVTPHVEAQVEAARCEPGTAIRVWGTAIRVWGTLETETIDVQGRRIVAERAKVASAPPTPAPGLGPAEEPVAGWRGRIVPLCHYDHLDNYSEREDGVRFGIDAPLAEGEPTLAPAPSSRPCTSPSARATPSASGVCSTEAPTTIAAPRSSSRASRRTSP